MNKAFTNGRDENAETSPRKIALGATVTCIIVVALAWPNDSGAQTPFIKESHAPKPTAPVATHGPYYVPCFIGDTEAVAERRAEQAHLRPILDPLRPEANARVESQNPDEGESEFVGRSVTLTMQPPGNTVAEKTKIYLGPNKSASGCRTQPASPGGRDNGAVTASAPATQPTGGGAGPITAKDNGTPSAGDPRNDGKVAATYGPPPPDARDADGSSQDDGGPASNAKKNSKPDNDTKQQSENQATVPPPPTPDTSTTTTTISNTKIVGGGLAGMALVALLIAVWHRPHPPKIIRIKPRFDPGVQSVRKKGEPRDAGRRFSLNRYASTPDARVRAGDKLRKNG